MFLKFIVINLFQATQPAIMQKNSSTSTVLAMFSNMIGPAMLSIPIMFRQTGIISSTLVLIFAAFISFITCRIYVLHCTEADQDAQWTIKRILGKKWETYFRFFTGFHLILVSIITLDLIIDQLYAIIYSVSNMAGSVDHMAKKTDFSFSSFSTQWLSLLLVLPFMKLVSLKKITLLIKLAQYGSVTIFAFAIYVILQFCSAAYNGQIIMENVIWFSMSSIGHAGQCSLAFILQTIVITFTRQNKNAKHNQRDLGITYLMGFALYQITSVLGTFAVSNKECSHTLVDCYLHDWTILIVSVSFLFGRIAVLPCLLEIGRTRILELFCNKVTDKNFKVFNVGFIILATIFTVLSPYVSVSFLMNFSGSVICYLFIYLVPTKIHYACLYPKKLHKDETMQTLSLTEDLSTESSLTQCNHEEDYVSKRPWYVRRLIYGIINVVGVIIAVSGFYSSIKQITGG